MFAARERLRLRATHVVNYGIGSFWRVRDLLSSRIFASWKNRHTANDNYLVMQTHRKTDRSKGCKRLRVLVFVHVLQIRGATLSSCLLKLLKHTAPRRLSHTSWNLVRRGSQPPSSVD